MKNHIFLLAFMVLGITSMAQHVHRDYHSTSSSRTAIEENNTLTVVASHDERFMVYVDGDMINRMPQSKVVIDRMDYNLHDIYVVLTSPENKINMITYSPVNHREKMEVHYDRLHNLLHLHLPQHFESHLTHQMGQREICSYDEVMHMLELLKKENFDSSREKLAMDFVMNHNLVASHIMQMAQQFSFESSKKDFLKKAYPFCVDPENYAVVVNCLTYSSDKKELLDYIGQR